MEPGVVRGGRPGAKTMGRLSIMTDSDMSVLRARAENGDETAVDELIELATEHGDMNELRRLADQGNTTAADQLMELTAE